MAMPRFEVPLEKTYPYLLKNELKDFEIISKNQRANTIKKQASSQSILDDIVFLNPKILIVHLGIVDCAPRLFTPIENLILSKLKWINKFIIAFFSKHRFFFTKYNPKVYVKKSDFYNYYSKLIKECKKNGIEKIFLLNICDTNVENKKKSFNFEKNIYQYNTIIKQIADENNIYMLDMNFQIKENMLLEDGIHINEIGHFKVFEILIKALNKENIT
ncbi:SGNH/GDSL hydrolase family protein [Sulfurimonas sp. C5]|nr:SGNH/GDSL hydrolase family protein [Sulfurimonas sp. C5]